MKLLIGLLSFILVVDCLLMVLLVLIQLPKKEAGLGTAFGGGATDALFGAGTGTALTKLTKYTAAIFLGLSMILSVMIAGEAKQAGPGVSDVLRQKPASSPGAVPPMTSPSNAIERPAAGPAASNALFVAPPATNIGLSVPSLPTAPATNPAP